VPTSQRHAERFVGTVRREVTDRLLILNAVEWAWWVAGVCLLIALMLGMAWTGADQLAHAQPANSPHESDEIEWNVRMPVSTR